MSPANAATERGEIVSELKLGEKFLVTTHENPDGDALGSLLAMHEILKVMGKDSVMFMSRENFPLPYEYRHLPLEDLVHEIPADAGERTIVFLDCGNIDRMPVDFFQRDGAHILNIDHHHDNTCFGTANLVVGTASCTAEILYSLLDELDVELNPRIAEALYVGLVTDTGRFQYENTTADSHRMAADLIEAGVDVHGLFRRLYENVPLGKVLLMGRVLTRIQRFDDGRLTVSYISREDYEIAGSDESLSEGIVDHIRALDGTLVAALVREQLKPEREGIRKVSLRAANDSIDVSVIARKENGGGHRQAAGFSTEKNTDDLIAFIRAEISAQVDY
jgi:bifunctional oligoribonuclease and PAP phosphatase NrnA